METLTIPREDFVEESDDSVTINLCEFGKLLQDQIDVEIVVDWCEHHGIMPNCDGCDRCDGCEYIDPNYIGEVIRDRPSYKDLVHRFKEIKYYLEQSNLKEITWQAKQIDKLLEELIEE